MARLINAERVDNDDDSTMMSVYVDLFSGGWVGGWFRRPCVFTLRCAMCVNRKSIAVDRKRQ